MPNVTLWANAQTLPDDLRLRARLAAAAQRIIDALDALDAGDEDKEDDDPAEDDHDAEEECDEPSLGATHALDQRTAWRAGPVDGEAAGTEDDLMVCKSQEARETDRQAAHEADKWARQIALRARQYEVGVGQ